jgi:hypothetical protein
MIEKVDLQWSMQEIILTINSAGTPGGSKIMNLFRLYPLVQVALLSLLFISPVYSQKEELRNQYFTEASDLRTAAKTVHGDLYAPSAYQKGMKLYSEAAEEYMHAKNLTEVYNKLHDAEELFRKA